MRSLFSPLVLRRTHTFLSLFFAPLLLLFIATGCWQMLLPEDYREENTPVRKFLEKLSTIHTDGYFPRAGEADPSTIAFRVLVGAMGVCLLVTILLGLWLAWKQSGRKHWALLAIGLGVVIPIAILWLA
ncbi:MAG: hypothetical protein BGO12_08305 [Verrucomicrobia bacterium 61-8]|nr:hypothetical protein [Verrucomicrobiota bacterium]OJV11778.1 MAG: hypothetical protein BGO12_08305 [Verrucomicrobia bacterium 61-8]